MNTESVESNVSEVSASEVSASEVSASVDASVDASASAAAPAATSAVKVKGRPGRKVDPTSNLSIATNIFNKMQGASRSAIVKEFIAAKIPDGTANAYYHLVLRKVNAARAASGNASGSTTV